MEVSRYSFLSSHLNDVRFEDQLLYADTPRGLIKNIWTSTKTDASRGCFINPEKGLAAVDFFSKISNIELHHSSQYKQTLDDLKGIVEIFISRKILNHRLGEQAKKLFDEIIRDKYPKVEEMQDEESILLAEFQLPRGDNVPQCNFDALCDNMEVQASRKRYLEVEKDPKRIESQKRTKYEDDREPFIDLNQIQKNLLEYVAHRSQIGNEQDYNDINRAEILHIFGIPLNEAFDETSEKIEDHNNHVRCGIDLLIRAFQRIIFPLTLTNQAIPKPILDVIALLPHLRDLF